MTDIVSPTVPHASLAPAESNGRLLRHLLWLALPVLTEHVLHMLVGLTDTYLANHLPADRAPATAAVGTIGYIVWFMGLLVGTIATGSGALIARASGARHRSLANSVAGQSMSAAVIMGILIGAGMWIFASSIVDFTQLSADAKVFALSYLRMLAWSMPFVLPMFVANACLRGAGDTLSPAVAMILVDVVNIVASFSLTHGWFGLPEMGFAGIAIGTVIAYVVGGVVQFTVLILGRRGVRLHLHRMRPHWLTLKRIFRIGVPSGVEGLISWVANFAVVLVINRVDPTDTMAAAHINAVRIESLSYLLGFAIAMAVATMVGQSLGRRDPGRATRIAYLGFGVGGGFMTLVGIVFILFPHAFANVMSGDAETARLTANSLRITGFIQIGFAAAIVFGGALRGAGDTIGAMHRTIISLLLIRLPGVLIVGLWLNLGLGAIWVVLSAELFVRGVLIYTRFFAGHWRNVKV